MSAQEKILDKGDLSQMFAFNAEPDEAMAQYTQQHQKETDFNYAMSGKTEDVGRIVNNANQEHRSDAFQAKKKKEHSESLQRTLHMQELQREMNDLLNQLRDYQGQLEDAKNDLKEIEAKLEVANAELEDLEDLKANGDIDDIKQALEDRGVDTENMSAEDMQKALDDQIAEQEDEVKRLEDQRDDKNVEITTLEQKIEETLGKIEDKVNEIKKNNSDWESDPELAKAVQDATVELESLKTEHGEKYENAEAKIEKNGDYSYFKFRGMKAKLSEKNANTSENQDLADLAETSNDASDNSFGDIDIKDSNGFGTSFAASLDEDVQNIDGDSTTNAFNMAALGEAIVTTDLSLEENQPTDPVTNNAFDIQPS